MAVSCVEVPGQRPGVAVVVRAAAASRTLRELPVQRAATPAPRLRKSAPGTGIHYVT